jgi:esterase/lipase
MKTDGFIKINRREAIPNIFTYRTVPTRSARELAKLGLRAQSAETLAAIDCPVLLLHSEGDRAADPAASRRAFEAIGAKEKQSRFYTERSNHLLLWDYDAEDVKERVLAFLGNP